LRLTDYLYVRCPRSTVLLLFYGKFFRKILNNPHNLALFYATILINLLTYVWYVVTKDAADAGSPAAVLTLPGDGRVRRGSSVVLQCRQSTTQETRHTSSIVWYRRCGDVRHQLAVEQSVVGDFGTTSRGAPRVTVSRDILDDSLLSNLTIAGKLTRMMDTSPTEQFAYRLLFILPTRLPE